MSISDAFYASLPIWAQHTATTVYGMYWHYLRFGPGFKRYFQEYKTSEMFSKEQWLGLQTAQLHRQLADCIKYIPYYRENWTEDQKRAALNGNLSALPLLEKSPLRRSPQSFLHRDLRPFCPQIFPTSGSTGTPISSYYTIPELRRSLALREVRSAGWAGVSFSMPRATFSGRLVEPDPESKGPFYRFNAFERQVYFSAFHLRPDSAHQYVEALKRHKI